MSRSPLRPVRVLVILAAVVATLLAMPHTPSAAAAAKGPSLVTPRATLDAALTCTGQPRKARKRTVLLVHGTGATPDENFDWNYYATLKAEGHPYCTVTIPDRAMGDLQDNVEYVVRAIRRTYALSGKRKIAIIGHSQGAALPAYALRVWPDLAGKVEDLISYAGAFEHGTSMASALCLLPCAKAFRQFRPGSRLLTAMAQRPMPKGPSYTAFATRYDEIVTPQPTASRLTAPRARNYVLQDLCPLAIAEHLTIIAEQALLQLALDALRNPGPGKLSRVGPLICGMDPQVVKAPVALLPFALGIVQAYPAHLVTTEPALRPYWSR